MKTIPTSTLITIAVVTATLAIASLVLTPSPSLLTYMLDGALLALDAVIGIIAYGRKNGKKT